MTKRHFIAASTILVASWVAIEAQNAPDPPRNLRIVFGDTPDNGNAPDNGRLREPPQDCGNDSGHPYFSMLAARPDAHRVYSLRCQEQLDFEVRGPKSATPITYNLTGDSYPNKQDAAKVVILSGKATSRQVRLPIDVSDGTALITWDLWYDREWAFDNVRIDRVWQDVTSQKAFMIASSRGRAERWLEIDSRHSKASPPGIALIEARTYGPLGPGTTDNHPLSPMQNSFVIAPETWTRYWVQIQMNAEGPYEVVDMWVADETRDPVRIFDHLQVDSEAPLTKFWLEFQASQSSRNGPELVAYVRNLVILHNPGDVTTLLQRP